MALKNPRYYRSVWLVLGTGIVLSAIASGTVWNWEKQTRIAQFQNQADKLATALQQSIDTNLDILQATGQLYAASGNVDRQSFRTFVSKFLSRYSSLYGLTWNRRILAAERKAFEQSVRAEGYPNFQISDLAGRQLVRSAERSEYTVVTYAEPARSARASLGFDVSSEEMRRATLERSRTTGKMTATKRIQLISINQLGFLTFLPVYRQPIQLDTQVVNPENIQGFLGAVFVISDIVKNALLTVDLDSISFYLVDNSASGQDQFLAFYDSRTQNLTSDRSSQLPNQNYDSLCWAKTDCTRNLSVADRDWTLIVLPAAGYKTIHSYWGAWLTFLSGLLITSILACYLSNSRRHTLQVEQLVSERTTQAKQLSETLQTLQQNMEMLDLASDAIIIRDRDDKITYWNQGAERLYGWTKAETFGQVTHDLFQTIFPQPLAEILEILLHEGHWEGELIQTKQDGTQVTVESRWTLQQGISERLVSRLEINSNITDKKQADKALLESQRFNQQIADMTPNLLYIYDLIEQRSIYNNRHVAATLGYPLQAIEQMGSDLWTQLLHPDDLSLVTSHHQHLATSLLDKIYEIEYRLKDTEGEWHWFRSRDTVFLRTSDGKPKQIIGAAEEITERKLAEVALKASESRLREQATQLQMTLQELQRTQSQLVQSEKMSSLGQLVAGVAHEINNPVNFIYGNLTHASEYAQNLLDLLELYDQQYAQVTPAIAEMKEEIDLDFLVADLPKLLDSMKVGADRIREIVQSLRNFSRLDEAEMKAVNIHEGIESTLMILANRLKVKPERPAIQVIKNYAELPAVECYPGQLNQVFMNLLSNAIDVLEERHVKLTPAELRDNPSAIAITTSILDRDRVSIAIADNGLGMPESVRKNLFNPFFTTKPIGKGTGLGLSISYSIVAEKHRGILRCDSEVSKGTCFWIEIPIKQTQKPQLL